MRKNYRCVIMALSSVFLLVFAGIPVGAEQPAIDLNDLNRLALLEEQGLENINGLSTIVDNNAKTKHVILVDPLPDEDVLLIPDWSDNGNVGMYDPQDGTFLGLFIPNDTLFGSPKCAIAGPDDNIYISDQIKDAVYVFNRQGNYLYTYADGSDGLNNIRGIDFRGSHLFVTSGDDYVAEFSGPHNRLADFINDGSDPFDIFFLSDGRSLLSDIYSTSDNVRLYNADGTLNTILFSSSFPQQILDDTIVPGDFLNAGWSTDLVTDFDINGTIHQLTTWDEVRGMFRLGNGNLLVTSSVGVTEIEPGTGIVIEVENAGISAQYIELIRAPGPDEYGAIEGQVTETGSGIPIFNVHVVAQGTEVEAYTDVNGDYILLDLNVGTYDVIFSHADYNDTTVTDVAVTANDTTILDVQMTVAGYQYLPGDVNMALGIWPPQCIGGDVTYLVGYFIGGGQAACMLDGFWCSADINGDCTIIGGDVTALVGYFVAGGSLVPCPDYEPLWPPLPDTAPDGWPNCDTPVINSKIIPTGSVK